MADRDQSLNDLLTTLHPKNQSSVDLYPRTVKNLSFAYNLVVNTNGQQFTGYKWVTVDSPVGGDYTVKQFCYSPSDDRVDDMSTIKAYLRFMTGTDFVPVYNAAEPNDMFVYLSSSEEVWKYQYDPSYGLVVFKVNNFPFALKSDIPELPAFPKTIQGNCLVRPESDDIVATIYESNFGNVKAMSIRIYVKLTDKTEGGAYAEIADLNPIVCIKQDLLQNATENYYFDGSNEYTFRLIVDQTQDFSLSDVDAATWTATLY